MTTAIKRRRGTTSQHSTFTGLEGEITIDTTKDTVVVHDGSTAGGFPLAKENNPTFTGTATIPTVDINGGTIDGAVIGGASAAAGTFTSATVGSTASSAAVHSYTKLEVESSSHSALQFSGSTGGEQWIWFADDSSSTPVGGITYYHGGPYMAFRVEGSERLRIDSSGNVGLGTTTPQGRLGVTASGDYDPAIYIGSNTSAANWARLDFKNHNAASSAIIYQDQSGNFSIRNDGAQPITFFTSGASERMRITSGGLVGIGTSSPDRQLSVNNFSGNGTVSINASTTGASTLYFADGNTGTDIYTGFIQYNHSSNAMQFATNGGSERMRIDSSGNVGIGTSTFNATYNPKLQVTSDQSDGTGGVLIQNYLPTLTLEDISGGAATSQIQQDQTSMLFKNGGSERMRIDSSGNVGIGASSPAAKLTVSGSVRALRSDENTQYGDFGQDSSGGFITTHRPHASLYENFRFLASNNSGTTERMRIDSSGQLMVGMSSSSGTANGLRVIPNDFLGFTTNASDADDRLVLLNRQASDGTHIEFRKANSTVGSIGVASEYLYIHGTRSTDAGLMFGSQTVAPASSTGGNRDDAIDLGFSGNSFDDVYATNGTIQTSDRNKKQDIEALSEAEQRVAVAAKGLLRKFRWKDSVEEKGDDARIHFGIIAQDLQAAFEAEGLDAGRYAMFINSTWTDEETGEERSRMGVRYNQLLAFIIAAI